MPRQSAICSCRKYPVVTNFLTVCRVCAVGSCAGLPVGFFGAFGSRIFITLTLVFQRTLRRGFLSFRPFGRPVFFFRAGLSSRGHKNCKLSIFGIIHPALIDNRLDRSSNPFPERRTRQTSSRSLTGKAQR